MRDENDTTQRKYTYTHQKHYYYYYWLSLQQSSNWPAMHLVSCLFAIVLYGLQNPCTIDSIFDFFYNLHFIHRECAECRLQILNAKMVRCTIVDSWHANIKETQWIYDICFSFLPENIHFQNCSVVFMLFLWNISLICCFRFLFSQFYCR